MKKYAKFFAQLVFFAAVVICFNSCLTTTTKYNWYSYQENSYDYLKKSNDASVNRLLKTYKKMIDAPTGTRACVPPGVCADYGWILVQKGFVSEGLEMLRNEIKFYPESEKFISQIIGRIEYGEN